MLAAIEEAVIIRRSWPPGAPLPGHLGIVVASLAWLEHSEDRSDASPREPSGMTCCGVRDDGTSALSGGAGPAGGICGAV